MTPVMRFCRIPVLGLVLCLLLAVQGAGPALAQGQQPPADVYESKARQAILIDARTGRVLYEKDADTPIPPPR